MYTVYNRKNERLSGHVLKLAVNECNLFKILTFSKILGMNKTLQCKIICNEYFCYFHRIYIKMPSTSYNISMTTFLSWKGDIFIGIIALIWHYEFFKIFCNKYFICWNLFANYIHKFEERKQISTLIRALTVYLSKSLFYQNTT